MTQYTKEDIGCYFDGAYGFDYNGMRVLHLAGAHGFKWTVRDIETPFMEDDEYDAFICEVQDAENYLNDNTTRPDNTHWSWEDGDFGLWQYDEDGELACEMRE